MHRRTLVVMALLAAGAVTPGAVRAQTRAELSAAAARLSTLRVAVLALAHGIDWSQIPNGHEPGRWWTTSLNAAASPGQLTTAYLGLEAGMAVGGMSDAWVRRRAAWIAESQAVQTEAQFARLLLEFEAAMKPTSVTTAWHQDRTPWMDGLRVFH